MEGFKKFIMRGNVVDLAVGIAIGAALNNVVNTFVRGIVTPLTGEELRIPDFSTLNIKVNGEVFAIGDVVNSIFAFILVAIVIYYVVVLPVNKMTDAAKKKEERAHPASKKCAECLSDIPVAARRCAHCASLQNTS